MAVTPHTNIFLLKVPLEIDNKNQITFTNKTAQHNYFNSLEKLEIDDCKYLRKDSVIRYPAHIDDLIEYNYVMYQNENYSNKWFYCFITNMRYENDNMTSIFIKTDTWQTWQFDLEYKQSFVEREMCSVADDIPGNNLLPEGLELGELTIAGTASFNDLLPVAVVAYARNPQEDGLTEQSISTQGATYNGIPTGAFYCVVSFNYLSNLLRSITSKGFGDSIMTVFTVPAFSLIGFNGWTIEDINSGVLWWITSDFKANPVTKTLSAGPSSLDGFTPHNKKLLTYPYCYLGFNPPNGNSNIYRYENFTNGTPSFKMYSELNPNPSVYFVPQNYKGLTQSLQESSTLNGYPTLCWVSDYFNSWLARNSEIINLNMEEESKTYGISTLKQGLGGIQDLGNIFSTGTDYAEGGGSTGGLLGSVLAPAQRALNISQMDVNHEYYVKQQMAQIEQQRLLPNSATSGSSNTTLLGYDLMDNNIFIRYNIKRQFAERIDKFFDMYGYLTNTVKIPNINNRPNWNYVKTIGINLHGYIPQNDLQEIKNMFNNGITLWHNTANFLDYSKNNR